ITFGGASLRITSPAVNYLPLGYIDSDRIKALVYNAADVFVHPARVDNLPLVVLESLACGLPVVAFPIGGIPDMVRPALTGWLAPEVSAGSLAKTIEQALGH